MQLSIIIVNYQSFKELSHCLDSIEYFLVNKIKFEVIVVNNEPEKLSFQGSYSFSLKTLSTKNNLGFGSACNLGASEAQGEFYFFLNPDTKLEDDQLISLLEYLDKKPAVGVAGIKIIDSHRQTPQPWTSGKKISLFSIFFRNTFNKPWNKKISVPVDWVSGTALLIRKKIFKKINGFDEHFWMYFEDQDLCLRVKNLGKRVIFYPYAKVTHYNGKSWKNSQIKKQAYYQSQKYFFHKHHTPVSIFFLNLLHKLFFH